MLQEMTAVNTVDENGRPAGGYVTATGLEIRWQDGPLGRGDDRIEPNGAFVETVIAAAKQRIEHYNAVGFGCEENDEAIRYLGLALAELGARTKRREAQGVEGTHQGN